jgi:hypothetical protein
MRAAILLILGVATGPLGACAEIPKLAGLPPQIQAMPVTAGAYRDLADLPDKPAVPPAADNQQAVQSLNADRARAAQEADHLRQEPFVTPDPPSPSEF